MFFPFVWSLPKGTRTAFFLAGCTYIGGAVGVEIIGAPMDADTMLYNLTTVAEEGMEMAGVILFLAAMLRYMTRPPANGHEIGIAVDLTR